MIKLKVYKCKFPLRIPYLLSFGILKEFESVIVIIEHQNKFYWGEVTALPGYSWETIHSIWDFIVYSIKEEDNISDLYQKIMSFKLKFPFAVSALATALDKFFNRNFFELSQEVEVPVVGTVGGSSLEEIELNVKRIEKEGYSTIKFKLLGDVKKDIQRLNKLQQCISSKANIRLDANQSYDHKMVRILLDNISIDNIELLEQPFLKDHWSSVGRLVEWSPVPIMLDESIWSEEDLKKAYRIGIKLVKFKLMKHAGMCNTLSIIDQAKSMGLKIIFGNGVQTDLGCIDEVLIYTKANLKLCAEMNGFLKLSSKVTNKIKFKDGNIYVNFNDNMSLNEENLERIYKYQTQYYKKNFR